MMTGMHRFTIASKRRAEEGVSPAGSCARTRGGRHQKPSHHPLTLCDLLLRKWDSSIFMAHGHTPLPLSTHSQKKVFQRDEARTGSLAETPDRRLRSSLRTVIGPLKGGVYPCLLAATFELRVTQCPSPREISTWILQSDCEGVFPGIRLPCGTCPTTSFLPTAKTFKIHRQQTQKGLGGCRSKSGVQASRQSAGPRSREKPLVSQSSSSEPLSEHHRFREIPAVQY